MTQMFSKCVYKRAYITLKMNVISQSNFQLEVLYNYNLMRSMDEN